VRAQLNVLIATLKFLEESAERDLDARELDQESSDRMMFAMEQAITPKPKDRNTAHLPYSVRTALTTQTFKFPVTIAERLSHSQSASSASEYQRRLPQSWRMYAAGSQPC
jgi:hypothetical protein